MWHDLAVPGHSCALEMIHPHSADVSTTKLRPSMRRQLSLAGTASEQPKENDSGCLAVRFSKCHDEREAEIKTQRQVNVHVCQVQWMIEMWKSPMFTTSNPDGFATELVAWRIETLHWLYYISVKSEAAIFGRLLKHIHVRKQQLGKIRACRKIRAGCRGEH